MPAWLQAINTIDVARLLSLANIAKLLSSGAAAVATVNLDGLFAERCREFAWEAWHRNDLIRFGKFEDKWIFPIPSVAISLNPKLAQNDGYN